MKSILIKSLTLAVLALGLHATAQSYTNYWWTNKVSSTWGTSGNWTNRLAINAAPPSSQTNILWFNVGTTGFTASNNIAGTFLLNQLNFGGTNVVLNGNPLMFTNNGTVPAGLTNTALSGTQIISNSIFIATNLYVGGSGTAGVTIYGPITATNSATGFTNVALVKAGTYNLTLAGTNWLGPITHNGGTLTLASSNYVWRGPILVNGGAAGATLNINGPTAVALVSGTGNLQVGNNAGDRSLVVISNNFTPYALQLCSAANTSTGAVWQTGGTVNITTTAGTGVTPIGYGAAACYGYYRITGGALASTEIDTAVGNGASGCFDILGGTVTPSSYFLIGRGNSPQFATVNVWGGTVNAVNAAGGVVSNTIGFGYNGGTHVVATLNIGNGGSFVVNPSKTFSMMIGTGGDTNTLTLATGGTLTTPQVFNGNPASTNQVILNLVGGTLQANTNSGDLIKNLDNNVNGFQNYTYLHDAGGFIDSQSFTVTNNASLMAATGNGIRTISISSQGAGYIAAPIVSIADPSGWGATAIAQINPNTGALTNILVTCGGVNYSANPTITLIGGGATTAATLVVPAAITGGNAGTGWLTKLGSGTLVMSSPYSSYGGNTTNAAGRLLMGIDNPFGSIGSLVMNGGTLGMNGVAGTARTLNNPVILMNTNNNFEVNLGTVSLQGVISGPGGLNKTGTNILYLEGNNTFTGGVTNTSTNAIVISNGNGLGVGPKTVYLIPTVNAGIQPNLTLDNSQAGNNGNISLANNISFIASASGGAIINANGSNTINGNISITGGGGFTLLRVDYGTLAINGLVTNIYTGLRQLLLGGVSPGDAFGVAGYLNGPVVLGAQVTELTKQDPSLWVVNSTNTYNGGTYVNGGTLKLGATGSMTNSTPIAIASGATFDVSTVGSFALTSGHSLTGNGLLNISGNLLVSSNATISPSSINSGGTVVNPAGTLTVNGNVVLNGGSLILDLGDPTVAGGPLNDLITNTGNLTITAPVVVNVGQLTAATLQTGVPYPILTFGGNFYGNINNFTNTQNFRGGVSFSQVGQTIYMQFGTGTPGTLTWRGDGLLNAWDLNTTSNWVNGGNLDLFRSGDAVTFDDTGSNNVPVNLVGSVLNPSSVTFNATKNYTLAGASLTGYGRLEKDNSGTLLILNSNIMSGGTLINSGVLQVGNGTSTLPTPGPGPITNNATLIFNYGGGDPIWPNWVTGNGTWIITSDGANRSPTLLGDNSGFTGTLYVTNGSQRLEGYGTNYGNPSMIYVANNGQIWPKSSANPINLPITISGMGSLIDAYPSYGALRLDGVTWSGPVTLSGDASLGANANGTVSGNITGPYKLIFAQAAGKIITLSGNNNYASTLIINAMAQAGANDSTAFSPGPLTMQGGVLQLNGNSFSFTNLTGTAGVISNGNSGASATITVGGDNTSTVFAGTFVDGVGSQPLLLNKIGNGELTLSGASTFTGGTTIGSGTIAAASASALGNGPVTVNAGATLRVNSLVATNINLLKIGGTAGLTLNDGSTVAMSLSTNNALGSSDFIYVTNALTLGTSQQVQFNFSFAKGPPATNAYYTLITNLVATTAGNLPNFTIQASHYGATFTNTGYQILVKFTGSGSNLVWTGDGLANAWKDDNTVLTWYNGVGQDFFGMGDSVLFGSVGSTNPVVNVTGNLLPSAITVDTTANNYTFTGGGNISGVTGLTKTGSGTLTINTTNDFTGVLTISNGTVSVPGLAFSGAASPIGAASSASANLVLAGGNLQYTGPSVTTDHGATLNASSSIEVVSSATSVTNSGIIAGAAGNTFKKAGPGTLYLSGVNTYSGDTVIDNGIVRLGNAAGMGAVTGTTYLTNSGTLDINGLVVGLKPVVVGGTGYNGQGVVDNSSPTTAYTFNSSVTMEADTTFNASVGRWDIRNATAALICSNKQPYNLTKIGTNYVVVSSGATVDTNLANINILAGTFSVEGVAGLGNPTNSMFVASNANFRIYSATVPLVKNAYLTNGSFEVNAGAANLYGGSMTLVSGSNAVNFSAAGTLTNLANITGSGSLAQVNNTGGNLYLLGTNSYTGGTLVSAGNLYGNTYSLQGNITNNATMTFLSPGINANFNGLITGTGAVNHNSTSTTTFTAANNFSGTLTLNNGMVAVSLDNAVGTGTLNFNGGGLQSADSNLRTITNWFVLTGASTTLGAPGTGNLLFNNPQINNGAQAKTVTISNTLTTISGTLTNTGTLTKTGPGTLALTGGNNNISALTISQGTLALGANTSITNAATVMMASQTTLDASATGGFAIQSNQKLYAGSYTGDPSLPNIDIIGTLTNNSGEIVIGDFGVGAYLNINGSLTLNGGTMDYDLTDPSYTSDWANDAIYINGPLTVTGTVTVNVPPVIPDGTYYLIQGIANSGVGSTWAANFTVPAGLHGTYVFADDTAGDLTLTVSGASGNTDLWQGYASNGWDFSTLNWTNAANLMATNFNQGDIVIFDDSAMAFANATNVDFGANILQPTTIIVSNNAASYTLSGTNSGGKLSGSASLIKRGTGVLTISATNDFYGAVSIQQGLVVMGNTVSGLGSPLGNTNRGSITITNGATLDLHAAVANVPMFGGRKLIVSGTGYDGNGAVINNGPQQDYNAVQNITLSGNATFGANNRWDIRLQGTAPATLSTMSNAFSLTKTGTSQFSLVGVTVDPYLADINVQAGLFSFESTSTSLGNPTNTVTMQPNTTFQIWGATNWLNKKIVLNGGATLKDGSGANTIVGPITINSGVGTNIIDTTGGNLSLLGPVGGASGFIKLSANTLILGTNNTWAGGMIISNGTVQIGTNGLYGSPGSGDITNYTSTLVYNVAASNVWNNNIQGGLGTLTVATNTGGLLLNGATYNVGQVNVNGGSLSLNGTMNAGTNSLNVANGVAGQTAVFQIVSGSFTNTGQNNIGTAVGSSGIINQSGGNFTMTGTMAFGGAIGEYAAYQISGGNASFGGDTQLGRGAANNGAATLFSQTGGTVTSTSWFTIARDGGIGVLDISSGTHFRPTTAANRFYLVGNTAGGFAQVTLRGTGILDDEDSQGFSFGSPTTANAGTAMVNLNPGGTLVEKTAFTWGNSALTSIGYINFNGGTLRASGSSATYLQGWTAAYVHGGGAIIDSSNNSITIAQPLLVSSGNGVTSVTASGSGFVTPPVVSLSGGGGVGATALAQIDSHGNLTGVLISNPGENYTTPPTVTFLGGGGTATGTSAIGPNDTTGGLTKLGVGTLTLSGINTYNGASVVSSGNLAINGANASGATVNATGVLSGSGSLGGTVTVNSGGTLNAGAVGVPGTLTVGSAIFNTGSTNAVEINRTAAVGGGTNDLLVVNGSLTLNPGAVVNVNPVAVPIVTGTAYTIITYTGSLIGSVANLSATGLGPRYSVTFANVSGTPNAITMTVNDSLTPSAYTLVWQGDGAINQWSTAGNTNQFTNSLGWAAFNNADTVRFDDTSLNLNVNLSSAVMPTTATVASSNNYTFSGNGKITGPGANLIKAGSGTLTINTTNDYTGGTLISNGVIKVGVTSTVLGLPTGTTPLCVITNAGGMAGAALDLNGVILSSLTVYTNPIVISGRSSTNAGAIYNSGTALGGGQGISNLVLAADAAIGNTGNRFDVTGYVNGGGKNLTELPGSGSYIAMYGGPVNNLNSIVAAGLGASEFGKNVTSIGGAPITNLSRVNFYQMGGYANPWGGVFTNSTMYMSNSLFTLTANNGVWGSNIVFFPGTTNTFDDGGYSGFGVFGNISGAGALKKQNTNTLALSGNNTYSGNTLVTAGKLVFTNGATVPSSPMFVLSTNTLMDESLVGGLTLNAGQMLVAAGTNSGQVNVSGGGVSPGTGLNNAGTLTISSGGLTLNAGSTLYFDLTNNATAGGGINDLITLSPSATYPLALNGGNIFFNPLSPLSSGNIYQLVTGGATTVIGSAANLTLSSIVPMNQLRQTFNLDSTTYSGSLVLKVTGGSGIGGTAGPLVWQGTNTVPNWDVNTTVNWLNNAIPGADVFYMMDAVQFDDTPNSIGGNGSVTLNGSLLTTGILVSNNIVPYTWSGSGTITGAVALVKAGSSSLTLNLPLSNSVATLVREGTVAIGVNNALPNLPVQLGDRNSKFAAGLDLSLASQTIPTLNVSSTNLVLTNFITIGSGQTMTVGGAFIVGFDSGTNSYTKLSMAGAGSLLVTNASANVVVGLAVSAANAHGNAATLDLSQLASVTFGNSSIPVSELRVGYGNGNGTGAGNTPDNLILSDTNNLITATNIQAGNCGNNGAVGNITLGAGVNVLNADTINIGLGKMNGTMKFASQTAGSPGTVTIGGKTGPAVANIWVGYKNGAGTGATPLGTLDLRGHAASVTASNLSIAIENASGNASGVSGALYFDTGTFTVTNVNMAAKNGTDTGVTTASLNVGGGTFTVGAGGSFVLCSQSGSGSATTGTLNLTGGTFNSLVDITRGSGVATGTITLNGGTLNMQGHKIGGTIPIDVLNFQGGTLQNVAEINAGASGVIMTGAGTLVLAGNNTYTGSTVASNGTVQVNGTIGGNTVTVATNATLGGYGTIGGPVTVQNGGTLALGATNGVLTVNNTLTLQPGSTNTMKIDKSVLVATNDLIKGITTLGYNGTLNIVVTGPALVAGDSFQLFTALTITGSFAVTNLPALNPGLVWDTSGLATGVLRVASSGPTLTTVIPNPVTGSSFVVPLSLTGSGFVAPCTVLLTNLTTLAGTSYPATFNSTTSLSVNNAALGTGAGPWNATVVNSGGAPSGQVAFSVTTPLRCQITGSTVSAGNISLSGTGGVSGYTYVVVGTTDVSQPLSSWLPVYTNTFGAGGSFSFTIPVDPAKSVFFYTITQ
jgi:autotransporter-associated beta strand protein